VNSSKIKLCLLIPSLEIGGMERVMTELIWYFSKKENLEIHLVLFGINRGIFFDIPNTITIHKPPFKFDNSKRFFHTIKTMLFLRKEIKNINPDSILSFGEYWNNFVMLSLLGLKFPVYVSDHCQPNKSLGRFHEALRKWLYPKTAGIIALTSIAKEVYSKKFVHKNVKVIGNPIRKIADTKSEENTENIVLSVGRLIQSKNHDKLIELFAKINAPDWKLLIIGGNALRQDNMSRLKQMIKDLNVEDKVFLEGDQSDVESYYKRSKIFAFTSSSEGFPVSIGEAMSAALPVVSFDCVSGPADMIDNEKNGFLIELFDYEKFTEVLSRLMNDQGLRMTLGKKALEDIKRFSIEAVGEEYLSFILTNVK